MSAQTYDPDANLAEQRLLVARILDEDDYVDSGDAVRLAELVQSLNEWIENGGFLPKTWVDRLAKDLKCAMKKEGR